MESQWMPASPSKRVQGSQAIFSSPKRKRDQSDIQGRNASPMRLRTELPCRPLDVGEGLGPASPRSKVSDQLKAIKLNADSSVPLLNFEKFTRHGKQLTNTASSIPNVSDPVIVQPAHEKSDQAGETGSQLASSVERSASNADDLQKPDAAPSVSPTGEDKVASSLLESTPETHGTSRQASPRSKAKARATRPSRVRSPPPNSISSAHSDLVWSDAEITGHNPDDPADDGYGINGIGFRPTAAIAQARTQRRRQQVAEWKSREAKEARQRRFERRKGLERSLSAGSEVSRQDRRRVRFVD